jgi:hypothetical protein
MTGSQRARPTYENAARTQDDQSHGHGVELLWIPLGSGQRVVRISGRIFEALSAWSQRRPRRDLYHSALIVRVPHGRFTIEVAPVEDRNGERRGAIAEGPVGTKWAGRWRVFRYEVRRWRDGNIPDASSATSRQRLPADVRCAQRLLDVLPSVPVPVWGRDELGAGEMWNSNSVVSWALSCGGIDAASIQLPPGGRAPGWDAGLIVAARARSEGPPPELMCQYDSAEPPQT